MCGGPLWAVFGLSKPETSQNEETFLLIHFTHNAAQSLGVTCCDTFLLLLVITHINNMYNSYCYII